MQHTLKIQTIRLIACSAALLFAAGCATETKKAETEKPKEKDKDYVLVTPTGSRIPVKVKKGQNTAATANEKGRDEMSNQQRMAQEGKYFPTDGAR